MRRYSLTPRPNWRARCDEVGFSFYDLPSEGDRPYWNESAAYGFTGDEITMFERVTQELFDLCMEACEHIVRTGRFAEFGIPGRFHDLVRTSWDEDDPTVYGRFDLAYDNDHTVTLLEFNADTPTSLVETAAAQWQWLIETRGPDADQFNSLHERLVEQWRHLRLERWQLNEGARLHLASLHDSGDGQLIVEDADTVAYMAETAAQAGFDPKLIFVEDIRYELDGVGFVDADGEPIRRIFKLYPWEWMLGEQFGGLLLDRRERTRWVEPAWKLLLSNKQLLVVLWEMFPGHPNLLPASAHPLVGRAHVRKPRLGREGANVTVLDADGTVVAQNGGGYGEEGFVHQARAELARVDGKTVVIGSWIVGETPAGIDVRETSGPITGDLAEFVPHFIEGGRPENADGSPVFGRPEHHRAQEVRGDRPQNEERQ
ncbi:glutathionylspermidine synthase family protein [Rathayibacter iranicus]|uniref:Glutathionylspermidine synthase family protein n=2 Tax=Rathayibacter iranicus TaxID=59737 RepID=A0AAD1AFM1_9MICO|nr:glutathionylspermidine synthase family protein [Rathayibacter iranicus]AZZ56260.1 glutathionylspermidine synthase family protein [Rathayibacter iranicus]MWV30027.1 glutathionylspermidine synthase family protein [Rathayibacter iranicus NCPPB 2253 = VKM Ac-1602]PPI45872.1 glutathionylspermidine synthase [Rathayibacter iranicus]PPI59701.1 glutathionylspermidine synthase [Rathayibacter iranicus]PPI70710.1 glutathionylspermidine synthase [Rathayibacter iranicus]